VTEGRLHGARHSAGTVMLLMGVPPRVAMQVLSHSQFSVTARYTHVVSEMATEAAERVGEALWGVLWPPPWHHQRPDRSRSWVSQ
jgi:integrase